MELGLGYGNSERIKLYTKTLTTKETGKPRFTHDVEGFW